MNQTDLTTYEKPKTLEGDKTLFFWHEKEIGKIEAGRSKALRFLEEGCIKKITDLDFDCLPIKDYNKTTYHINISDITGEYICTCQFNKQNDGVCSHIQAVRVFKFMKDWNEGVVRK